ncbi:VOC family protein [Nocardioides albidus]|uniref:VOC family protein n=1 Tax=Nocardioides albidus TaxID=1517589 RepID=A0A5C4VN79_9ACTN|nr:VOC family protein [Nocardioides albidus]TNM37297.1 VOC family protein [Nocardioides albidus]
MAVTLAELVVADPPEAWRQAGFTVDDDGTCRVGTVRIRLAGRGRGEGIVRWALAGVPDDITDLDGVPTTTSTAGPAEPAHHPNGITHLDHVVLLSPDLARTTRALEAVGLEVRRRRDGELGGRPMTQVFLRLGPVILEVVGSPDAANEGPSSLWGLTHTVADIDAAAALLGERTSPVKDAVQPGRRITTLRHRGLGMSVRTALISPHVRVS